MQNFDRYEALYRLTFHLQNLVGASLVQIDCHHSQLWYAVQLSLSVDSVRLYSTKIPVVYKLAMNY